jgi:hypothetical protein
MMHGPHKRQCTGSAAPWFAVFTVFRKKDEWRYGVIAVITAAVWPRGARSIYAEH